jgi:putative heme-binding domain-containing protein
LLASDDEWTAPIMAEVGPDGNVWVLDWYNYIVQHNPIPAGFKAGKGGAYETPLRDKKYGRIYRVVWKDAKPSAPFSLGGASPETLVATLKHDNMFWRLHAQRLLVERGNKDVVPALVRLVMDGSVDGAGLNPGAIHALWALHGLGALEGGKAMKSAVGALRHISAGVRRNAVQVLPRRTESVQAILDAGLLNDIEQQVRLAALLALADQGAMPAAGDALVGLLHDEVLLSDRWLSDAETGAAAAQDAVFLPALARLHGKALPTRAGTIIERVAEHHARGGPVRTITALVAALPDSDPAISSAIIAGLARGWPRDARPVIDAATEKALGALLPKLPPAGRAQLITLADRWGSKALDKYAETLLASLLAQVRDDKQPDSARIAAAVQLIEFRKADAGSAKKLLELLTPQTSPELSQGLLDAIARSDAGPVGEAVAAVVPSLTPVGRSAALRLLLSRADWTAALLAAIDKGTIPLNDLSLDQKQQLAAHPIAAIATQAKAILSRGGSLPSADREKVISERLALTRRTGDAAAGKVVFKTHCAKCHMHNGEGEKIGPDLTGMNVHPKEHLLIDILDPSRSVEGNFRLYTIVTKSGRTLSGLLTSETKTAVELFDAEAKKHTVLRENIDELTASTKSLMPEGFEKQMSDTDLTNLLEFLAQRGQYLPLPLEKAATVVSTRGMFYNEGAFVERLIFPDWSAKTFEGVPFHLIDPRGDRIPNVILLNGPEGTIPPKMPKSVRVPCNAPAKAIHLLSGISGWGFPYGQKGSVSMIVRLHYDDGKTEDHPLKNGEHFADYIRRVDVPGSKFAFDLQGRQVRYLAIHPKRTQAIKEVELLKGPDQTAPVVMAVTVESP